MSADLDATLAKVKVGDEVTATLDMEDCGTFVLIGRVWLTALRSLAVGPHILRFSNGNAGSSLIDLVINKPALDPEPPIGSVVLDDQGDAWQSYRFGREAVWRSVGDDSVLSWERFTDIFGPVRVVYTPEVTP